MQLYMVFRLLGDISHTTSKLILIWAIHCNRSAEGVSLITQALYLLVFCARYLDWFWKYPIGELLPTEEDKAWLLWWNFVGKIFYVTTSAYIVAIMMRLYPRTREREKAWRLGAYCLLGSVISSPLICLIFRKPRGFTFLETLWTFSIELESVCVLPQLLLLRQTTVPTVIDSFYLATLGSYRGFYFINWMVRLASGDKVDPIPEIFGLVQTALYIDFAWVYFSRQRVKLRGGGVVDSDDLSRGWLVSRFIGYKSIDTDDDEEAARRGDRVDAAGRWGPRGISVSADDGVREESEPLRADGDRLTDPEAFEDDLDSDAEERSHSTPREAAWSDAASAGAEWRGNGSAK